MKLDKTDVKILKILQTDGRITNAALAQKIGISPPPTLDRVKKLEQKKIIKKYVALVNPADVGVETFTFVEVTLLRHGKKTISEFLASVMKIKEVMECHHVTGDADFMLKIAARNIPAYEEIVLHRLTELPHIQQLKTMVVLSTTKCETALDIELPRKGT